MSEKYTTKILGNLLACDKARHLSGVITFPWFFLYHTVKFLFFFLIHYVEIFSYISRKMGRKHWYKNEC